MKEVISHSYPGLLVRGDKKPDCSLRAIVLNSETFHISSNIIKRIRCYEHHLIDVRSFLGSVKENDVTIFHKAI